MQQAIPVGNGAGRSGLVRVFSNTELMQREEAERKAAQDAQNQPVILSLATHVRRCWEAARDAKNTKIQSELLDNLRRREGQYSDSKLAEIRKQGGSDIWMNVTQVKCRTTKAWIKDVLLHSDDKPWALEPTPLPEMPPEIMDAIIMAVEADAMQAQAMAGVPIDPAAIQQQIAMMRDQIQKRAKELADELAQRMEDVIEDQMVEGGFTPAFDEFLENLVTFKNAFFKGPILRRRRKLKWEMNAGQWSPNLKREIKTENYSPSPLDIYPSPDATSVNDGYLIERHKLSRSDLLSMIGVEGYDEQAIRAVLDEYGRGGLRNWLVYDQERASLENRINEQMFPGSTIDALQYWGSIQGKMLIEWGMDPAMVPDPMEEYEAEVWQIGNWTIKAVMNDDPLGRRPYYGTSIERIPGAFWGRSLPEIIKDPQDVCNACGRALVNNMGMASGPMMGVNTERLAEGEDPTDVFPWRVWQYKNHPSGISEPPIHFFQPDPMVEKLLKCFEYFSNLADDYSGIPRYANGNENVTGAAKTASGLSMLMSNTSKVIRGVIANVDVDVIEPMVMMYYHHNMMYHPDNSIKGDLLVRPQGAISLFVKEQMQIRRNEFLVTTNNPTDMAIIGLPGRAEMLRGAAKALDYPVDKIVPDEEQLRANMMMQAQAQMEADQQQQQQPGKSRKVGPDGRPVSGQDTRTFNK